MERRKAPRFKLRKRYRSNENLQLKVAFYLYEKSNALPDHLVTALGTNLHSLEDEILPPMFDNNWIMREPLGKKHFIKLTENGRTVVQDVKQLIDNKETRPLGKLHTFSGLDS